MIRDGDADQNPVPPDITIDSPCSPPPSPPLPASYLIKKRLSVHMEKRRSSLTDYLKDQVGMTFDYFTRSASTASSNSTSYDTIDDVYGFRVRDLNGNEVPLDRYRGHVLIIVNVASECGLTHINYEHLNYLHDKYYEQGLRILAFPCNQFGQQEPGSNVQISDFLANKNVKFDIFAKINVNGDDADPLFLYLQKKLSGSITDGIKWNFTKFLINKHGTPVDRFSPTTAPKDMEEDILYYLNK